MKTIKLPPPILKGKHSLEEVLFRRRSIRSYRREPIPLGYISQLMWAGQGITSREGFRTAPSAGALYPMELFLIVEHAHIPEGIYHYLVHSHALELWRRGSFVKAIGTASLNQEWVLNAPALIVVAGVPERTAIKYGPRALRYVILEAGHVAQNIALQATALGLGTVPVGAFYDGEIRSILGVDESVEIFYVMPIGFPD